MSVINRFLNRVSMYRLMLYFVLFLLGVAIVLSFGGILSFNPVEIIVQTLILVIACYISNQIFAGLFRVKPNFESQFITALILTLIIGPISGVNDLPLLLLASVMAMGSKYLIAPGERHIFNPAAFGVLASALILKQGASWWIGTLPMAPFILLGGLVVAKKIGRGKPIWAFFVTYFLLLGLFLLAQKTPLTLIGNQLYHVLAISPLLFFAFVMLVEPLTSPSDANRRVWFGSVVAALLALYQSTLSSFPYTLELALVSGNVFARLIDRQGRAGLIFKEKKSEGSGIYSFWFEPVKPFSYLAGQFLEWSLPHTNPDSRGTRRFFTIASSPTEKEIMLATKIVPEGSSFKRTLSHLASGEEIHASQVSGEFTLPKERDQKCIFIAGGIGITPFRSMIKYLKDKGERQPITLFYSARTPGELAFQSLFDQAKKSIGLKPVYTVTDDIPKNWKGKTGFIDEKMIKAEAPDFLDSVIYISGPEPMVQAFEKLLKKMGVRAANIRRDYFPGYDEIHQAPK